MLTRFIRGHFIRVEVRQVRRFNRQLLLFLADLLNSPYAIGQRADIPLSVWIRERSLDTFQDKLERNSLFHPGFHQDPIERGKESERLALCLEKALNFREVVEVV